jgi:Mn2+/Fe2+ NRAMP family transporter
MSETEIDPYAVRDEKMLAPPKNFLGRIKYLGPSLIITGAAVGSGELVLTTSLGAVAGWALLWWLLLACLSKSFVQAELARYTVVSGDTYLRAVNRLPGKIWKISWPIWMGLLAYIPGMMGLGGIIGGGGESLSFLLSLGGVDVGKVACTGLIAVVISAVLSTGSYRWLESISLPLVVSFTLATLVCAIAMQFTDFHMTLDDLAVGFSFDIGVFVAFAAFALAAYGFVGSDPGGYTYWCIEKGYPNYLGTDRSDPQWEKHARSWMKVLHTDVWVGLIIMVCATVPFYVLGAGVLNAMGLAPDGSGETIAVLSNIFTQTLGQWAVWVFSFGAFFILFSTVLSDSATRGRFIPDYLIEMGFMDRSNVRLRKAIIRWYVGILPLVAFLIYLWAENFVFLIIVGGATAALFGPINAGATIWLQKTNMDPRIQPRALARYGLRVILMMEIIIALSVIWFVVLGPFWS